MRVVISYPTEEMAFVTLLRESLRQEGITCFVANWDAYSGERLWPKICKAILQCDLLVALYTEAATRSAWVNMELGWADAKRRTIVPITEKEADLKGLLQGMKFIPFSRTDPSQTIREVIARCKATQELGMTTPNRRI